MEAGQPITAFWDSTPKIIQHVLDGYAGRVKTEHRRVAWLAYHIEALARTKRLPDIARLMGERPKQQSEEEILAALERFAATHNAAWRADTNG